MRRPFPTVLTEREAIVDENPPDQWPDLRFVGRNLLTRLVSALDQVVAFSRCGDRVCHKRHLREKMRQKTWGILGPLYAST